MRTKQMPVFSPEDPPDLEHATHIREEAFDWLNTQYPGVRSFTTGDVLRMAGEEGRRWLIARLRSRGIGNEELFGLAATADALTVLFLRSRGVKFREAVDAVAGKEGPTGQGPRYGGVWNRLIRIALKRLRRRLTARLLGSAVFALLRDAQEHPNSLIVVKRHGPSNGATPNASATTVTPDHVYSAVLERPAPSCWVLSPFREVLFLDEDQLPTRAEITARHFLSLEVHTERDTYELLLGTMSPAAVSPDGLALRFVGRILDIVFLDSEDFLRAQASRRFEAANVPELSSSDDLQLWLVAQFLDTIYPGSLCEISDTSSSSQTPRVLASSAANPWEPSLWDPPKTNEMLSGYASRVGVPLVVRKVEHPWTSLIESVGPEMRYLNSTSRHEGGPPDYSALALPITLTSGESMGALYMLLPRIEEPRLEVEVRILSVFSRIVGEIVERQRAAIHTANLSADVATFEVLKQEQFRTALLDLLSRKADGMGDSEQFQLDQRLPFLMISAHSPDPDEYDPAAAEVLKNWLVETLHHMEWRSFVRTHWAGVIVGDGGQSFVGELPGAGILIALDRMVSKDELDRIRNAFPATFNRTTPTNSPVKLVAWVLDVPAKRILDAAEAQNLQGLADDVERWAFDVATVVDDVAQSEVLARRDGEWDAALRRVRRALRKEGGRKNGYLYRLAADCSFSLGDWPGALKYARQGVTLSRQELGSGFVRSMCQQADAHLCLCEPVRAWDLYTAAAEDATTHPLPRYYRGQALLLMSRLLQEFENERRRAMRLDADQGDQIAALLKTLVDGAMDDLTSAADLLDHWGLIPETYQYRNFHLVPTFLGQGTGYLLTRSPGPAASRIQSARRAFPKDDLFYREYLFAKCWEQGLHRRYGELLLSDEWTPLRDRLNETFGEAPSSHPADDGSVLDV